MNEFAAIDPVLNRWAERHGLNWERENKGFDVRSVHWPLGGTESVQIWIDPPEEDRAAVKVAHNSGLDSRRRTMKSVHHFEDLESGLGAALATAMQWRTEALS